MLQPPLTIGARNVSAIALVRCEFQPFVLARIPGARVRVVEIDKYSASLPCDQREGLPDCRLTVAGCRSENIAVNTMCVHSYQNGISRSNIAMDESEVGLGIDRARISNGTKL